jgi:hypothetical protein
MTSQQLKQKRRLVRQRIRDDIRMQIRTTRQRQPQCKNIIYWRIVPEDFHDWKELMGEEAVDYDDFRYWEQKYVEACGQIGVNVKPVTVRVSEVRKYHHGGKGPPSDDALTLALMTASNAHDAKFDVFHDLNTDRLQVCGQADEGLAGSKKEVPIPKHWRKLAGDLSGAEIEATYIPMLASSQ